MSPPPVAPRRPREVSAQGQVWSDDYAWLRADNWREVLRDPAALAAEIRAWLEAENAYCDATLAPFEPLRKQLAREMRAPATAGSSFSVSPAILPIIAASPGAPTPPVRKCTKSARATSPRAPTLATR